MHDPIVSARGLSMRFTVRRKGRGLFREKTVVNALSGVNFNIGRGELLGYIGPNGAGKSTTVKCLCGILRPTAGDIVVNGRVPYKDRIAHVRGIGVVFGQRTQLWWDLPVIDSFLLLRDIYKLPQTAYKSSLDELIDALDIEKLLAVPVRQLSLGQRMRCDIAASLLHRPELLLLDEPTIGLDAISKLATRAFLKKLNTESNTTILITTHDMDDIEALCSRVLMINDGNILLDGGVDALRGAAGDTRVLNVELDAGAGGLRVPDGARLVSADGRRVCMEFDRTRVGADALVAMLAPYGVRDLVIEQPPIEEAVKRLYERAADGDGA